ncbi:HpcH/HpaI aldolase family protein [Marinobacterium rhizophilum]|uniref:HpcH/HpaI aldolase family protein n=1 Tax=Marinobacterium rhizophilum TaxID=420402 RepID=UPI00036BF4D7|nr:aldolase/citrate lyase family protein [Marinobacterium rhizophilum]
MLNLALQKWRAKEPSLGIWSNLPDIHMAEVLCRMDVDWICFDLQHGLMDYSDLTRLLPAITGVPTTPLVRVAANQPEQIGKALDAGAQGVIVPMVNSADDARRAVAACRYPPQGSRSCGPMRDAMLEGMSYLATANQQVACLVMIETAEGLRNLDEIAAVEGVDGLFVGPMDLCYGLGLAPGNFTDPAFTGAIAAILKACEKNALAAGIFGVSGEMAANSIASGFDFASIGTDISFIRAGALQTLSAAQGKGKDNAPNPRGGY